jgi:hypothetical protein
MVRRWRLRSMRIGFLFNHDQIHQIAHSLPIALALAETGMGAEIIIATTNARIATEVVRMMGPDRSKAITLVTLGIRSASSQAMTTAFGKLLPAAKLLIYRDNLDFFRSLDALVVTERTSLILKTRYGLSKPTMILADHGAGDRAIGFGKSTAQFDHILAAGPKIRDRLIAEAGVDPARLTVTGYSKFDLDGGRVPLPIQANGLPTVLYNPHVSPHLSSWYKQGRAVLDYFVANPRYNLIFAPHIMLFQRRAVFTVDRLSVGLPGSIERKYRETSNIHIDLGSVASTDMTYTNAADIYLGDVSSQVYEFLRTPRPCVFLNTHGIDYRGNPNFAHWQAGPVIGSVEELGPALGRASADQEHLYRPIQKSLFDHTFDLTDEPSSHRAASVISSLVRAESVTRLQAVA